MANRNINGVDVDQLFSTIDAIKETPGLAKFEFRANNRWINGGHNRTSVKDFYGAGREDASRKQTFVFDNDEPVVLLGEDNGANPVEFVLHALAGCLTTSLVYHAAAQGIKIDAVESTFEGDLDLRGTLGIDRDVSAGSPAPLSGSISMALVYSPTARSCSPFAFRTSPRRMYA